MQCKNCGANFASDQLRCPYCEAVNEHALKLAKELQQYDKKYEKSRDEMLNTGDILVLKRLTIGIGLGFLAIILVFAIYVLAYAGRYGAGSKYNVSGMRYSQNKAALEKMMENKEYIRAYTLAAATDPTTEYFEYYPEYKDELTAIYDYSILFTEITQAMQSMDAGDNYRPINPTFVISLGIFYRAPESEVKAELEEELAQFLRNFYRLTDEEIESLKTVEFAEDFTLDGEEDYEKVSKERMVAYFGK